MASRILHKPKAQSTKPSQLNVVAEAHKEMGRIVHQLEGLSTFCKALGEANEKSGSVVDLNDLTFGFSYLLDATEAHAEQVRALLGKALGEKGGAA
jgi:hypothetical protein